MKTIKLIHLVWPFRCGLAGRISRRAAVYLIAGAIFAPHASAANLRVMKMGLGAGTITSPAGINCGTACEFTGSGTITLTAEPASAFVEWGGDCSGQAPTCEVTLDADRSVRAEFQLSVPIPTLSDFTPEGLRDYLIANPTVNSPGRFLKALRRDFKQNWILMSRSEALQTGTAQLPRILLPSEDAQFVFTVGLGKHSSYPGAHPNAIEYMQWDAAQRNFRFHEIVLADIPEMGTIITLSDGTTRGRFPARPRGVAIDDSKCSRCHSTQNVLNLNRSVSPPVPGSSPGTDGLPPGTIQVKNKPNWDSYDSWGGMMPFNRDRIYKGSVEAAAFRKILNFWSWRTNDTARAVIEQLELQPPGVVAVDAITRVNGGPNDGHINFAFDTLLPVLTEPAPSGTEPAITTNYSFNGVAGTGQATTVVRGGSFVLLRHTSDVTSTSINVEGRGVQLFDLLGGLEEGKLNQRRVADELINHRFATGSVPIDIRPIALAITKGCLTVNSAENTVNGLDIDLAFFNSRNGMSINDLVADTRARADTLPRRKADIQKHNLDRTADIYLDLTSSGNGLIQEYGAATSQGTSTETSRIRQEVFRRPIDLGQADATVMGGIYVDREFEVPNTERVSLYRYFLEPLGVSVDKWSMGVRSRSLTYTFADVFSSYTSTFTTQIEASLGGDNPIPGLAAPFSCPDLITAVKNSFASLPAADAVPKYTDVQRILNKSCIECHGGLNYPPVSRTGAGYLDFSENEDPAAGDRLTRSHAITSVLASTNPATSLIFQRITSPREGCPDDAADPVASLMPCGGPALSKADIETIRRWIVGATPNTAGDPHIKTVDGTNYDFQSAGEFVLLRGENLEIQARQTAVETEIPLGPNPHTGLTSCVSVNTAVAIRVGPHRITYEPNLSGQPDPSGLQLRVDSKLLKKGVSQEIRLSSGGRILPTTAPGGIQIEFPGGTDIVVTPAFWVDRQLWYMNIDVRHARASEGIMGAIAPGNWLPALPDGTLLGGIPSDLHQRHLDLYETFADAWRVNDTTSLFDYAPGTSTATFTLEAWPGEAPQTCRIPSDTLIEAAAKSLPQRPGRRLKTLPLKEAKRLCRAIVEPDRRTNCELDVMVTGERGFAKTYLLTERIQLNKIPAAPKLLFPKNNEADLARTVFFTWKKTADADADKLRYRHCLWGQGESFTFNNCKEIPKHMGRNSKGHTLSVTVSKLKRGKTYFWKVIAEDGQGGTAESESWRFTIRK